MKRIRGIKTYRFDTGLYMTTGYCTHRVNLMITEDRETLEATLYCDDLGDTYYMFGTPKELDTLEEFLDVVEDVLPRYISEFSRKIMTMEWKRYD